MNRPSLFRQIYVRAAWLMLAGLGIWFLASWYFQSAFIYSRWRDDLQQEADWLAGQWKAQDSPQKMVSAWSKAGGAVRLLVLDADGKVLADSRPSGPPPPRDLDSLNVLTARAAIPIGTIMLLRGGRPDFPLHPEIAGLLAILAALGVALFYPLVRNLRGSFDRLAAMASRVAGGRFGETLPPASPREIAELTESFNDMSLKLEAAEQRQRRLIADVSHELRSPMGRLRALIETIARRPEETESHLAPMSAEIALMDRLVGDMLEMARADNLALVKRRHSLRRWTAENFARHRARIEQSGAVAALLIDGDGEAEFDDQRLTQALGNLIDNAAASGAKQIEIDLKIAADRWSLAVIDNGRGIAPADLPHVFDRFYRAEKHRGRAGGAGLGLSIAKAIVEAHGGQIELESKAGTTARMSFPTVS